MPAAAEDEERAADDGRQQRRGEQAEEQVQEAGRGVGAEHGHVVGLREYLARHGDDVRARALAQGVGDLATVARGAIVDLGAVRDRLAVDRGHDALEDRAVAGARPLRAADRGHHTVRQDEEAGERLADPRHLSDRDGRGGGDRDHRAESQRPRGDGDQARV
jgi:hypothetical protein